MKFKKWLVENHDHLDNLYLSMQKYIRIELQKKDILDLLNKEDFFVFIYQNTKK